MKSAHPLAGLVALAAALQLLACQDTTPITPSNTTPAVSILQPDDSADTPEYAAGTTIEFMASVSDSGDAPADLLIEWSSLYSDGESTQTMDLGATEADASGVTTLQINSLPSATHTVTVTVTDTGGLTDTDSVSVVVLPGDAPPTVAIEEPLDGDEWQEGDLVTFVATAYDDAGPELLSVSWSSNLDGEFDIEPSSESGVLVVTTDELSVGDHAIEVTVTDASAQSASASVTIHILMENAEPSAPLVEIEPAAPTTDDDLLCVADDSVDPNGDVVSYAYEWLRDGAQTGITGGTVFAADTTMGEEWTCQATPSDGELEGPIGEATVTIVPEPGDLVVSEVMIDPAAVDDSVGEWFEVFNASDNAIDLDGWTIADVVAGDIDVISSTLVVQPGAYATLGNNWDPSTNGNVPVDYWYSGFSLDDTADEIVLSLAGVEVDRVEYDLSAGWPALLSGQAMMLQTAMLDHTSNDDPAAWCGSTTSLGAGLDFGTPGAGNDDCACFDSDLDLDGFGTDASCDEADCDDGDPSVFPGAPETCEDGVDSDCDGGDTMCVCEDTDLDGDGYGTGILCPLTDCDDGDPSVYPGALETCNGVDDDCSGSVDEGIDLDGDGWYGCGGDDCDDADDDIYPGAVEACNGVDDDCDGVADDGVDGDGDGWYGCGGDDCDDADASVNPGANDVCDNVDVDCDGVDGNDEGGDAYEPNEDYYASHHLYTNNTTSTMSASVTDATLHAVSDQDWFYIYQADPFGGWFDVQGSISPPAGVGAYLELYKDNSLVDGGPGSHSVSYSGGVFTDDGANYDFRIVWESGTPDPCATYTLTVSSSG